MPILTDIHLDRAIIHSVSEKQDNQPPLIELSAQSVIPNNRELEKLIARINSAFADGSKSLKLSIKNSNPNTTPQLCHRIIQDPNNATTFDQSSTQLAQNLADSFFTSNIPGGLLVLFLGTDIANRKKFVLLIKAEIHDGFLTTINNGITQLKYISSIVLSKNSKFYKFGLFLQNNLDPVDDSDINDMYDSYVFDLQINPSSKDAAAEYFYSKFMNCDIQKNDTKLTKMFYEKTKEFIKRIDEDALRLDADINLKSFLRNENFVMIDIQEYSKQFIPLPYQDLFLEEMESEECFQRSFTKNTNLIKTFLRRDILKFNNGVEVRVPQDEEQLYEITEQNLESTTMKIYGRFLGAK